MQNLFNRTSPALSYDDMNAAPRLFIRSPEGEYKAATRSQILAAGRKAAEGLVSRLRPMTRPAEVKEFFQSRLASLGHEAAAFLYLDSQHKPLRYLELAHGTLCQASVYPREVVKTGLRLGAAALIISHNHPSGATEPSTADLALTRHLKHALALVDISLLDHLIVTPDTAVSLAERGQI